MRSTLILFALFAAGCVNTPRQDPQPPRGVLEDWTPVQVGVWGFEDIQIFDDDLDVYGLRLNLPSGSNRDVYGLDLGLHNHATGDVGPLQLGVLGNDVESDFVGIQLGGIANRVGATGVLQMAEENSVLGLQLAGLVNVGNVTGIQASLFNGGFVFPGRLVGAQLGAVNAALSADGVQLGGLWNISKQGTAIQIAGMMNVGGSMDAVQIGGLYNDLRSGRGAQVGIINSAGEMSGVQLGVWNHAKTGLVGLQIGLLNFNEKGFLPFFPILNFGM